MDNGSLFRAVGEDEALIAVAVPRTLRQLLVANWDLHSDFDFLVTDVKVRLSGTKTEANFKVSVLGLVLGIGDSPDLPCGRAARGLIDLLSFARFCQIPVAV